MYTFIILGIRQILCEEMEIVKKKKTQIVKKMLLKVENKDFFNGKIEGKIIRPLKSKQNVIKKTTPQTQPTLLKKRVKRKTCWH